MSEIFSDWRRRAESCSGVSSATIRPPLMITTRWHTAVASGRMWVLRMTEWDPARFLINSRISIICFGSSPTVGSSRIKTWWIVQQRLGQPHALAISSRQVPDEPVLYCTKTKSFDFALHR